MGEFGHWCRGKSIAFVSINGFAVRDKRTAAWLLGFDFSNSLDSPPLEFNRQTSTIVERPRGLSVPWVHAMGKLRGPIVSRSVMRQNLSEMKRGNQVTICTQHDLHTMRAALKINALRCESMQRRSIDRRQKEALEASRFEVDSSPFFASPSSSKRSHDAAKRSAR